MPKLSRWFIKSGLLFFVISMTLWICIVGRMFFGLPIFFSSMAPTFYHMLMVGWITQIIFGVSYWMFPTITRDRPRGREKLGWTCFILLNLGLLTRLIGEPLVFSAGGVVGPLLLLSGLLQWTGGVGYVAVIWKRVRPK